jgi:hypothetical protein
MAFTPPITTEDVKAVGQLIGDDLSVHINSADLIVSENLEGKGLSAARLRLIGVYLAAHFAFVLEGQIKSEKIGDSATTFSLESGQALSSTVHGQQAISLDTTGTLASMSGSPTEGSVTKMATILIC